MVAMTLNSNLIIRCHNPEMSPLAPTKVDFVKKINDLRYSKGSFMVIQYYGGFNISVVNILNNSPVSNCVSVWPCVGMRTCE